VVPGAEQIRDEIGFLLEIETIYGRIRREAGVIEDQELESLAQRKLLAPGRTSSNDAPVGRTPADPRADPRRGVRPVASDPQQM
jgi:hypothetical protein